MKFKFTILALFAAAVVVGCTTQGKLARPFVASTNETGVVTHTVSPEWTNTLAGINAGAAAIPSPVSPWVGLATTAIAAGLGLAARHKGKKAEEIARTVVTGIETLNNEAAKKAVYQTSKVRGNANEVADFVQKVTH